MGLPVRQKQTQNDNTRKLLMQLQEINQQLHDRVNQQEKELKLLRAEIRRLMSNN